jgi:glutamyl-tRNA reductase
MRDIVLLGLNHKTAPVDVRECIAFTAEETDRALTLLRDNPAIGESVLFSTCNRIELLMAVDERTVAVPIAKQFIAEFKKIPLSAFEDSLYQYVGDDAVRHAFQVAASLDSMVVGEPQILGQMKAAYRKATWKKPPASSLTSCSTAPFSWPKKYARKPVSAITR